MKKRMKILALSMAVAMTCTCMPVNASTGNDIPYSSAFSFTGWMSDLWNRITGNDDKKEETSSDSTPVELQVIESEDTVENGDMLRASTYAVEPGTSSRAAEEIRYFDVTMYNYDTDTINQATHKAEVEAGTAVDEWTGLYFNNGTPEAESYTYSSGDGQAVTNLTWRTLLNGGTVYYLDQECINPVHVETITGETYERSYPDCSDVISRDSNSWVSTNYYYTPDGGENYYPLYAKRSSYEEGWLRPTTYYNYTWGYSLTDTSNNVTQIDTQNDVNSRWDDTINITVYTLESATTGYRLLDSSNNEVESLDSTNTNQRINTTLYTNAPITTDTLGFAAYNFWTGNIEGQASAGKNGNRVYNGLVQSTLDASGNIQFTVPEGGIFNSDRSVKDIYTNVGLPFEYENGMYTFDSSIMNARFNGTPSSNTDLTYYDEPQSNGTEYGDGSKTLWLPFNNKQTMDGESECDYHFGMNATIPFTMTPDGKMTVSGDQEEDIVFSFSGDDDVWIFIDGQLVLDLGGIHNRVDATLNFAENTWELTKNTEYNKSSGDAENIDGSSTSGAIFNSGYVRGILNQTRETFAATDEHNLTIFYLERGAGSSNCKIQFNLPVKDSVSVQKLITQSKTKTGETSPLTEAEQEMVDGTTYGFTLYKDGEPVANTTYQLLNVNGQITSSPTTDRNGHFTLKNGETAKFVGNISETEAEYYVVEDTLQGYVTPDYTYDASTAGGYAISDTDYDGSGWVSKTVAATGGIEAEDSVSFVCTNYLSANLPNPSLYPQDDRIVIDYGLPVEIENVLENDTWKGDKKELIAVTGAQYGEVTFTSEGKVTYSLTKQLTDVEVLTYTAQVTSTGNSGDQEQTESITAEGKIYIIPATTMYYEENFSDLVTYSQGSWQQVGESQTDFQETGEVGDEADSPYGSDSAYLSDSGDSNGTSRYVSSATSAAKFSYTFTGEGTSFYARTTNNTAYMKVDITDSEGNLVYNLYRDTSYKTEDGTTTLYNIPVFTWYADNPGTYTVTVSLANQSIVPGYGSDFWLDGIRVYKPLSEDSSNYGIAQSAYSDDSEANCIVVTLREKLIGDETVIDPETGELIWSEQDQQDGNFVVFTDTNGAILSASEYVSNGPKEEVYLNAGQKVSFALDGWNKNTYNLYLGIKAPMGEAKVSINGNEITVGNTTDCYYDISDIVTMTTGDDGSQIGTVEIQSVSGLISVTNIKATGVGEFELVPGPEIDADAE